MYKNVHQLRETYNELNDDLQYVMSKAAELKELGEEAVKTISKQK